MINLPEINREGILAGAILAELIEELKSSARALFNHGMMAQTTDLLADSIRGSIDAGEHRVQEIKLAALRRLNALNLGS